MEAHGGRIWVESTPGRGTTFTFALPLGADAGASGERADPARALVLASSWPPDLVVLDPGLPDQS